MKKNIGIAITMIFALGLMIAIIATTNLSTSASPMDPYQAPVMLRTTLYTDSGITATGAHTRYGVIAGCPDWYGSAAALYDVNEDGSIGDFIGYFEVLDTGSGFDTDGDGYGDSIKTGQSIDVWVPDDAAVREWQQVHGDYTYVYLIRGQG